ncbi:TPA: SH3 domain-containing protein [Streptococcus suis]
MFDNMISKEKQRFSIRKYSLGAASVLIGTGLIFGVQEVKADEVNDLTVTPTPILLSDNSNKTIAEEESPTEELNELQLSHRGESTTEKVEQVQESSTQVTPPQSVNNNSQTVESHQTVLPPQGRYEYEVQTPVRNQPSNSAPVEFYANAGDTVNYDKVVSSEGEDWISYQSYSGVRRYASISKTTVVKKSPETQPEQLNSNIADRGTYHFTKQAEVKNEAKVSAPTQFTFEKGDKVNYDKVIQADNHQWISYVSFSGTRRYVDLGQMSGSTAVNTVTEKPVEAPKVAQPTGQLTIQNQTATSFEVEVSNVSDSKGIKAIKVPVWADQNGQNDIIWYDAVKQSNGNYKVAVSLSDHKNEKGLYHAHLYYVENDGKIVGVSAIQTKIESKPVKSETELPSQGTYHFTKQAEVKNEAKVSAPTQFTFEKGDKVNYDKVIQADNHQWISYVSFSGTRRYVDLGQMSGSTVVNKVTEKPVEAPKAAQPTGQLTIQNQTATSFEVEVSNVSDSKGIKAIKVPVWADQNGQNDIVWYDAVKQSNGNYKVAVSLSDHKNEKGLYHAHLYYVENDGKIVGVSAIQTKIESKPVKSETELPSQGTYHFTKQAEVKNEAKVSAPTQFTFEKGDKVNYDKVIQSDNHRWISYVSYNGTRRYVDLGQISGSTVVNTVTEKPVEAPKAAQPTGQLTIQNQTATSFEVEVSNVSDSKGIKAIKVPVWADQNGQNDIVWYDAVKQSNGNYKVAVSLSDHKNEKGLYHAHLYYVENDGKIVGVSAIQTKIESKPVKSETELPSQGTYHFTKQAEVKNEAKVSAPTQFTFEKGDKVNYDKVVKADNHQWISYVSYNGTRRYVDLGQMSGSTVVNTVTEKPVEAPKAAQPTGQLTIQNQTATSFEVEVSNVSDSKGIKAIKVPVWADQNGQNDIVWYDAVKQSNGNYKVAVSLSDHKNEKGLYHAHLYYVENDGKIVGVSAIQTKIESKPVKSETELPSQGTYHFTKQAEVKNEAKVSAPTQFTFEKGDKVNYDKVIQADNHQWISYVSYNGTRRYVQLENSEAKGNLTSEISTQKKEIPNQGTYHVTKDLEVYDQPTKEAKLITYYKNGSKINYDKVIKAEGNSWISYVSYSGVRRFVKID